jgi:Uma2 family endonuclease
MDDAGVAPARHKLDADDFYRMAEAGIFSKHDRIELIDGDLIDMAPIGQGHEAVVMGLNEALVLACQGRAIVSPQNSLRLNLLNVSQPDFAVLRRRADFYATGDRPGPADVLLLIEVADSSLAFDRTVKLPLYARAGIAEYWIVDLKQSVLNAYRQPVADVYAEATEHRAGERVALANAPEIVVGLNLVFG